MNRRGFTLIEILIVISIIAILGAIALPRYQKVREKAAIKAAKATLEQIKKSIEIYYQIADKTPHYPSGNDFKKLLQDLNVSLTAQKISGSVDLDKTYYLSDGTSYTIMVSPKIKRDYYLWTFNDKTQILEGETKPF